MGNNGQELIEELEGILLVERHAICAGSFENLGPLTARKEQIMLALVGTPAMRLARVKDLAQANQTLLGAAIKGVRAAQRRLEMIRRAGRSLNSYDQLGRARTIDNEDPSVEWRA